MKNTGNIFNIQHFSLDDGPGIRTTVFFKGGPLDCGWGHNPESKAYGPEISFSADRCRMCGKCVTVCPENAHSITDNKHILDREKCKKCGLCGDVCVYDALKIIGKEYTVDEITEEILKDSVFFGADGGVTFSGGEPLLQYDFLSELLKSAKKKGINTAVETSGYTTRDLGEISRYVDLWLYDIKILDDELHKRHTGVSNKQILKNLFYLDNIGAKIILRCPIIPDINMNKKHFEELAVIANRLKNAEAVHIEPYHPLGISKSEQLGKKQAYKNRDFLQKDKLIGFVDKLKHSVDITVEIL